jgi:hypothetical protein
LFEILGRWSEQIGDDGAAVTVAVHSRHCGWRAEQWVDHLPLLGTEPPESFVTPPGAAAAALFEAVEAMSVADDRGPAALAGVYRVVVPALVSAYRAHAAVIDPVSEAPTGRMLRIVVDDLVHDGVEGETTVTRLLAIDGTGDGAVAGHTDRLAALLTGTADLAYGL